MDPVTSDILKFLAFGIVWLFPIAIVIAALGSSISDAKARQDDLGPNVVQFPGQPYDQQSEPPSLLDRIKQLAIHAQGR